jgi:protein gp37
MGKSSASPDNGKLLERTHKREHSHRRRVFCAPLADVFDNQVPPEWRVDLFALIRECYELDWLVLTKRPQNVEQRGSPRCVLGRIKFVRLHVRCEYVQILEIHYRNIAIQNAIKDIGIKHVLGHLRPSATECGSLAIFAAIRRAKSRVSGFVFSFEHLAARLKNPHYG